MGGAGLCMSLLLPSPRVVRSTFVSTRLAGLRPRLDVVVAASVRRDRSEAAGGAQARPRGARNGPPASLASSRRQEEKELDPERSSACSGGSDGATTAVTEALHQSRWHELGSSSRLSLAPMMDYTDRHFRHLVRLLSNRTLLYTEMVSANAVAHESRRRHRVRHSQDDHVDDRNEDSDNDDHDESERDPLYMARFVAQSPLEGPAVLQLGGSDPELLFEASRAVADLSQISYHDLDPTMGHPTTTTICDYTGLNLNCGCPSPKVAGKGCFGAALMDDPTLVRDLVRAMHEGGRKQFPVSVKCRIGTDTSAASSTHRYNYGDVEYQKLCQFIETVAQDGIVTDFSVHARIAVLGRSFSPADNRKIPPLRHDVVGRLIRDYPHLRFTINGGFNRLEDVQQQLEECPGLAGVMVGRAWAADPWSFAMADPILYSDDSSGAGRTNRWHILEAFGSYADQEERVWGPARIRRFLLRAVSPLFAGEPNAKRYRVALDEIAARTKRQWQQQKNGLNTPLSELLLDAAHTHLSQETLLRTAEETYEMRLWQQEQKNRGISVVTTSSTYALDNIAEWQQERKGGESAYNQTLQQGLVAGT